MRRDDRHYATRAKNEPAAFGLLDGIFRFCLDLATAAQNDGLLADPAAQGGGDFRSFQDFGSLGFAQGWRRLAVVPVEDGEWSTE